MALTAAERMRKYRKRIKEDPERRIEQQMKDRLRRNELKKRGLIKHMDQLTKREQRAKRKYNRQKKKEEREKKKAENRLPMSPPSTPGTPDITPNRQLTQHIRLTARKRAQCYRENENLKHLLEVERKRTRKIRKRLERMLTKENQKEETPRKKTRRQLKHSKKTVRKTLLFHNTLIEEIKKKYQSADNKLKQNISSVITGGNLLRKYGFRRRARCEIGIFSSGKVYKRTNCVTVKALRLVREFFVRDDNSQMTTGKKQTVTFCKIKKQKRLLTDTVKNLHKKFQSETPSDISYKVFRKMKPFWVKKPTPSERNTCLCKQHENFRYIVEALNKHKVLDTSDPESVMEKTVCDLINKQCMYDRCNKCNDFHLELSGIDQNIEVSWKQWRTSSEKRELKNAGEKDVKVTSIETETGCLADLIQCFYQQLPKAKVHTFSLRHQFKHYKTTKQEISETECVIHIDFSENYACKMHSEIQATHFGASKKQITLHTGMVCTSNSQETFCTVSDDLNHGPCAIWAHLEPILNDIRESNPQIDTVHFFSDSPATQYRQKPNFFLLTSQIFVNFKRATWNFFEAGHGKGVPDGVGAAVKRQADNLVLYGADIMNAAAFEEKLKNAGTEVKIHLITTRDISKKYDLVMSRSIQTVPGTMKIHQVLTEEKGIMFHREVSCTCSPRNCKHETTTMTEFKDLRQSQSEQKKKQGQKTKGGITMKDMAQSLTMRGKKGKVEDTTTSNTQKERINKNHSKKSKDVNSNMRKKGEMRVTEKLEEIEDDVLDCILMEFDRSQNEERDVVSVDERKHHFEKLRQELSECETFEDLKEKCSELVTRTSDYEIQGQNRFVLESDYEIDLDALELYPNDESPLFPVRVKADGSCLPHAASVFAFGHENYHEEIRTRIIMELTLNADQYLSHEYVSRGASYKKSPHNLPNNYGQYSEKYTGENTPVKDTFEAEVLSLAQPNTYMGIWQLLALTNILGVAIMSIYPKLGNSSVRKDLHRLLIPTQPYTKTIHIMWTSTRQDMVNRHWVPNHFVPLMPVKMLGTTEIQNEDAYLPERSTSSNEAVPKEISSQSNSSHMKVLKDAVPESEDLVFKYVMVSYNTGIYPGKVIDFDEQNDLYVESMHQVPGGNNSFMWPLLRDRSWCPHENIMAVIPAPQGKPDRPEHFTIHSGIYEILHD